jgi:phage regulator Rha-like protein
MTAVKEERYRGEKQAKTYFLNEQQATLLLTYLRNSEIVREFKKALVKAFYELKSQKPLSPQNFTMSAIVSILQNLYMLIWFFR